MQKDMVRVPQSMILLMSGAPPTPVAIQTAHILYIAPVESDSTRTRIVLTGDVSLEVVASMKDILTWLP